MDLAQPLFVIATQQRLPSLLGQAQRKAELPRRSSMQSLRQGITLARLLLMWISLKVETGSAEQERLAAGDRGIRAGADDDGDESYGFALRYYSEYLNSTEFALYYQKPIADCLTFPTGPPLQ